MSEKDRLNLLAVLESINKILQYLQVSSDPVGNCQVICAN